jgi:hypothetical protein
MIVNRNGKALDIPDGANRDGVRIQIYDANGEENQSFVLRRVSGGGRWGGGNWRNQGGHQGNNDRSGGGWGNQGDNRGGNLPGWGNARRLTCSSNDGRRAFCDVNTTGGVRMVRQISGSACREGHSWGVNDRGIWVDHGCRAEFEVAQPRGRGPRN